MDLIRAVAEVSDVPVACYNVSGEYAMVKAAALRGWIDEERIVDEMLAGFVRAGADIIITYFAKSYALRHRSG
jgi:porphobilinogen synthase